MKIEHTESHHVTINDFDSSGETVGNTASRLQRKEGIAEEEAIELLSVPSAEDSTPQQNSSQNNTNEMNPRNGTETVKDVWSKLNSLLASGEFENFGKLITDNNTIVDFCDEEGNTLLHNACLLGEGGGKFCRCIDILMSKQKVLNKPNKNGYTALGQAMHYLHKTCVEYMLGHRQHHLLHLDYYPADEDYTLREIIEQTYPELKKKLPSSLWKSLDLSGNLSENYATLQALDDKDYKKFVESLNLNDLNPWYGEPFYSTLLEIACQKKKRDHYVNILLDKGADPNIRNLYTGMHLIHMTARSGNFGLLKNLLARDDVDKSLTDKEGRTILHWWASVRQRKTGDKKKLEECLDIILESDYIKEKGIDHQDSSGNTALCIALERKFQDRAELLLSKGADIMALEYGSKILLQASSSVLEQILDDCLESNDKPLTSKDLLLRLDNEMLGKIVPRMAECKSLRDKLRHPVSSTWLCLKWQKISSVFFIDLIFYATFLLSSTAIILSAEYYNTPSDGGVDRNTTDPSVLIDNHVNSSMKDSSLTAQMKHSSLQFSWYILTVCLVLLIVREGFQLIAYRMTYIRSVENLLETILIVATFIAYSGVVDNVEIKLHFAAVAILLGWFELVLMTGRLPQLSVQLEMLKRVSMTFVRFMAGYVLLLVAFALCFYVLFKGGLETDDNNMFANPFLSLLRTTVMFTGEFEVSTLSFDTLPVTSHVIFILYVVLVAIVLLNLLNGLAVSDTEAIRQDAETLSLVARVKLISRIEEVLSALPKCMKPSVELTKHVFKIHPNDPNTTGSIDVRALLSIINKKMQADKKRKSTDSQENWSMFTEKLSGLQLRQEKMEKNFDSKFAETQRILTEILTRLNARESETTRVEF